MSAERPILSLRHLGGLGLVALVTGALVFLWQLGPSILGGTLLEDLVLVLYVSAAFALLTLVERIVSAWASHRDPD